MRRRGTREDDLVKRLSVAYSVHEPADRFLRWEHPFGWPSPSGVDEYAERDRAWADFVTECRRHVVDPDAAIQLIREQKSARDRELREEFGSPGVVPSRISPERAVELNRRLAMSRHDLSEWPADATWGHDVGV